MPDTYEKDYHLDIHGKHYSRIGMLILILVGSIWSHVDANITRDSNSNIDE